LTARQVGDRILLHLADDGKGIDPEVIKQAAIRKGFLSAEHAAVLSPQELLELTFLPGFSTMDQATEFSGRGVGLDVVRTRIQEFSGNLQLSATPDQGTSFTIELPTTIAISRVVVFRVGRQRFAVLNTFINRLLRLTADELITTSTGPVLDLDGLTVPVQEACDLLNVERPSGSSTSGKIPTLIIEQGGKLLGLQVDELLGEQELTIKPLSSFLSDTHGVSGAAVQRDGTLVLLLHVGDLLAMGRRRIALRPAAQASPRKHISRVLLVEDSMVIREIERSLLTSLGLEVEEAEDGAQALQMLNTGGFDLVVSDVDMPNVNGLELTQKIRESQRWSKVPIILVTTRDTPEDRQRGMECGADAYISKSEFKHKSFIEVVRRFMH